MAAGNKKVGKYDILDVIGRGGMGVIYKGVDPGIGRIVAIKMMTGAFADDPELLHRFYREAQSAGKLQHPNIVTIYDLGVEDGSPYLVMEFLEGESLDARIRTRRAMSLEEKLDIVVQVCEGVGYAHKRLIVHRDIKPGNVMLLPDGKVKIFDFGIARIGDKNLTRPGQIMGSVQYMSPEQINGGNVDARSDIFSIGVLLYQLLTGELPFEGRDMGETLLKIIHDAPPPLNRFLTVYPSDLDQIMQRVLAKDREQRFQAAEDLAFELAHVHEKLRRERLNEYLAAAEAARSAGQLSQAKEQLLQLLRIDRQNVRANTLLREVQQELQRQQLGEQARELHSEAERAVTRGELAEALTFLERAVELDKTNTKIVRLRDLVRKNKARSDRVRELVERAEMAQETGDLDEARRAVEEAIALEGKSTEVRALHAVIFREIAERDKQLKLQKYMGDARKQISARRFTAALDLLKQAELVDSALPGLQELTSLALSGQQQEKRRRDLERLTIEIEDALNRNYYDKACAKAVEGLNSYPDDRGLKKLKEVAEKELAAREKRRYIEEAISLAQKLVKENEPDAALASLQEALKKYPGELGLQSMIALVTENMERQRIEQKKSECIQQAREAIRRGDFAEAISLLETTRQELQSSDFDDLLQFAQNEAASHAKRQRVESVAEQARRLHSEEKYEEAIQLLEATLEEIPDQELEIILSDSRHHVEDFNRNVQEAISNAHRLMQQSRYVEAVKFLEAQPYGKAEQFRSALAEAREKLQFWQALCLAKAVAEKELAAREKRKYVEDTISLAQKLVKENKADAALASLQEALEKCPGELGLQSMIALVTENMERQRIEQKESECIQKAREAIRRRDFAEAISLLEAARQELQSSDLDDLLQFAQDEAASHATRQRVESVAEQAHRLHSEEKYEEAIQLLEATLEEIPDQELEIILSDSRRHVEDFNRNVQEAISNARRLMQQSRYVEAVKFLEAQPYGKADEFRSALAEAREKLQFWQALCLAKDEVRAAISRSDLDEAHALWQKSLEQFGDISDVRLLAEEINVKRREAANARVDMALRDARVLLLVRSFDSAVRVLETAAPVAGDANPELNEQFQQFLHSARSGLATTRQTGRRRLSRKKEQETRDGEAQPLETQQGWPALELYKDLNLEDETKAPDTGNLRAILGEVTVIADHYRGDTQLQTSIDALKQKITSRISELREAELAQAPWNSAFSNTQDPVGLGRAGAPKDLQDSSQRGLEPDVQMKSMDVGSPASETTISVETPPFGVGGFAHSPGGPQAEEVADSSLEQAPSGYLPSSAPAAKSGIRDLEAQAPPQSFANRSTAEPELENTPGTDDKLRMVRAAPKGVSQPVGAGRFGPVRRVSEVPIPPRPAWPSTPLLQARPLRNPVVVAAFVVVVGLVIGISVYRSKSHGPRVPIAQEKQPDPIAVRQQAAIDAADKLVAADDLAGAQRRLQAVSGLKGPLDATVQKRLAGISAAMRDEGVRQLRRREEQLWQDAVEQVDTGNFDLARSDLHKILDLGEGGQRKAEARRYLDQVVPTREEEERLFALAQSASQGTGSDDLRHAGDLLNQVIALNGKRKPAAETLRGTVDTKLQEILGQQRQSQIGIITAEIDTRIRSGDFDGARQQLDKIKQLGGDVSSASAKIDAAQKNRQAQEAEAVYQKAVQRYQHAVGSNNRSEVESAREDLGNIAKAGGPHAAEAAKDADQLTQKLAELDTPPIPLPVKPSQVPPAPDQEVRSVIQRYIDAFEHRDADALQQVWPTLGDRYTKYKKSFASASSIRMTIEKEQIDIAPGGTTALATTVISQDFTPKGERTLSTQNRTLFQLSKSNGIWRIDNIR